MPGNPPVKPVRALAGFPSWTAWALSLLTVLTSSHLVNADEDAFEARIRGLIVSLGDEQFDIRERAQQELQQIGVPAFDALDEAKDHDDIEVALRVRYLLRILSANWANDDDPPEVKSVLKAYGEQTDAERRSRMERLSAYGHARAISALCRLARFETNPTLSKHAALLVMSATAPVAPAERQALIGSIRSVVGGSRRPAAGWLRDYAQTLDAPASMIATWESAVSRELRDLEEASPTTSARVTRDLLRWQCEFLRGEKRMEAAIASAQRLITIVDGTPAELSELVSWFMEREYWPLVQRLAERFPQEFARSPQLVYRRAEAQLRQGHESEAHKLAEEAFHSLAETVQPHVEMAIDLRDRGLFPWAEREFRKAIELAPVGELDDLRTRYRFAEMLYDLDRPLDAATVWQDFIKALEADPMARELLVQGRQLFRARMHFFLAQHHTKNKEWVQVRNQLDQALLHDPYDADVLIAKHRLPEADDNWKRKTDAQIKACVDHYIELIRRYEAVVDNVPSPEERESYLENLANSCNQYAWLVGNTDGDVDEAIRMSHRSIELMPKTASYLDTLAHCYYAKRDYASAVKYQTMAAQRDPHSRQIQRQLLVFQKSLEAQKP